MYDRDRPWTCFLGGLHAGRCSTRQAAMNLVDRPWRKGPALVRHEGNGETWERRRGSWFKTAERQARKPKALSEKKSDEAAPRPERGEASGGVDGVAHPSSTPFVSRQLVLL